MADRGPNQDFMGVGKRPEAIDPTYRDASYLGTDIEDDEEVHDLGFIVDDHDDRRGTLTEGFQHLDDLDSNEPLETNRNGKVPHATSLVARGAPREWFATDYHVDHADAEQQEEDFVNTSMLETDPDMNDGTVDFTDETFANQDGSPGATDLVGHVPGVTYGFGTSVPQDLGSGGFRVQDNPLMQPQNRPVSGDNVSDEAIGYRDVDDMGNDDDLDRLANRYAQDVDLKGKKP